MATLDEFIKALPTMEREHEFKPFAFYNEAGDSIEVFMRNEERVSERINSFLSVLVAKENPERVLGVVIKNIKKHFGVKGELHFVVKTGRAKVALLVRGAQFAQVYSYGRVEASPEKAHLIENALSQIGDLEVDLPKHLQAIS